VLSNENFAGLIREIRVKSGLSRGKAAAQAGIAHSTLGRWETGKCRPWIPELERLLDALKVNPADRAAVMLCVNSVRLLHHVRDSSPDEPTIAGHNLLRAMRLRRGLSRAAVATGLGVSSRTLGYWESGDAWPSEANLHALCFALGAEPEELMELLKGPIIARQDSLDLSMQLHDAWRQGEFSKVMCKQDPLMDLRMLSGQAALQQVRNSGMYVDLCNETLAGLLSNYAQTLFVWQRFVEADLVALQTVAVANKCNNIRAISRAAAVRVATADRKGALVVPRLIQLVRAVLAALPKERYSHQSWMFACLGDLLVESGSQNEAVAAMEASIKFDEISGRRSLESYRWQAKLFNNCKLHDEALDAAGRGLNQIRNGVGELKSVPGLWMQISRAEEGLGNINASERSASQAHSLAHSLGIDYFR